jgi:hypothetical protein
VTIDGIVPFARDETKGGANHEDVVRVIFFQLQRILRSRPCALPTIVGAIPYDVAPLNFERAEFASAIAGASCNAKKILLARRKKSLCKQTNCLGDLGGFR